MKKLVKAVSLLLAVTLFAALLLSGCGSKDNVSTDATKQTTEQTSVATETKEQLEKVNLVGYLVGAAPTDGPAVMEEVNKKLLNDINATIELRYVDFADLNTKYPLILASGQDADFIYGSLNYAEYASKGSYAEIKMEDVQKYMPLVYKATSEAAWADALVNGKVYIIPQSFKELNTGAMFYREDLRKKYNVPEITKVTDFEAYMLAIKNNENGMAPLEGTAQDVGECLFGTYIYSICGFSNGTTGIPNWKPDDTDYKIYGMFDEAYLSAFKESAQWAKKLYDQGLISRNVFGAKVSMGDAFKAGKSALKGNAFENYPQSITEAQKGWEIGCLPSLTAAGNTTIRPSIGNGISFLASSKNIPRAMMAIDLITQNKDYDWLVSFGIENKDYVIKDGKLDLAPGIDPAKNPYPMYGAGWWMTNRDLWPPMSSQTDAYLDMKAKVSAKAASYLLNGFNPVLDSVKTEVANIQNVKQQYELPIKVGAVKDVDAAIAQLQEKLKDAGYEKVMNELKRQAADFVKAHTK